MIEIVLGLLSVGMVTCYVTSAIYCALNLWYNQSVIDPMIRKAFYLYFVATFFAVICGYDWIVNSDYMKVPIWQALGWGVIHVTMPCGYFIINNWICQRSSVIKCDAIKEKILSEISLQEYVGKVS